ncbi:MAG: RlpA-like double-psi beta-barrel domain-containing protein [Dehalococcoidia bacterium]
MMVAGTAAAVGMALVNERRPQPAFAEAFPQPKPRVAGMGARVSHLPNAREAVERKLLSAALIGAAVIVLAASIPALTALISSLRSSPASLQPAFGPPAALRSASGVAGDWARSYSDSAPAASQIGAAVMAGAAETERWQQLKALVTIAHERDAQQRAAAASQRAAAAAPPYTVNAASGFAPGAVLQARITIYGCTGPGGGYCNRMSSGGEPFAGAAACSSNLPFGTKLKIDGDPTGRTYECLDRGMLSPTWVDVYFSDTSDGMAWQRQLGSTESNIRIVN